MKNQRPQLTLQEVFFAEDNVVDMFGFKDKKERQGKTLGMLVTPDGQMMAHPDDMLYVMITSEEQGDALSDGDLERSRQLGLQVFEVGPGNRK